MSAVIDIATFRIRRAAAAAEAAARKVDPLMMQEQEMRTVAAYIELMRNLSIANRRQ